mmetsp:Transcript_34684/g.110212  ORF Transcript_34684/g.110212 Transcript_34684/m.110212 type:complete len:266 (+) Transcript_34684:958-1755(+)
MTLLPGGRLRPSTPRKAPTPAPAGSRTRTAPAAEKKRLALAFWHVAWTCTNASAASGSSAGAGASLASRGRSQSSVVRRPRRLQPGMAPHACCRSLRHCLPQAPSGRTLCSAPGISARKARPRTSTAISSRSASEASSSGGTRWTQRPLQSRPRLRWTHSRNSWAVALTAHRTRTSPCGRCAQTTRCLWLGGSADAKSPPAKAAGPSNWGRRGASSTTSRLRASSSPTSRKRIELEVLPPCWTCTQMPKSSWKRATLASPRRCCK